MKTDAQREDDAAQMFAITTLVFLAVVSGYGWYKLARWAYDCIL